MTNPSQLKMFEQSNSIVSEKTIPLTGKSKLQ